MRYAYSTGPEINLDTFLKKRVSLNIIFVRRKISLIGLKQTQKMDVDLSNPSGRIRVSQLVWKVKCINLARLDCSDFFLFRFSSTPNEKEMLTTHSVFFFRMSRKKFHYSFRRIIPHHPRISRNDKVCQFFVIKIHKMNPEKMIH